MTSSAASWGRRACRSSIPTPITTPSGVCLGSGSSDVVCQLPSSIVANLGDREDSFYDFLLIRLSFPGETDAVSGTVKIAKLGRSPARYLTRPDSPVTVRVRLRPGARRALVSGARPKLALTIRARDAAGNTSVTRSRLRLRAP